MDLRFENHGSIILLRPESELGNDWVSEHIPEDAMMFGGAIVIEPRYADAIFAGATDDGLNVG